MHCASIRDNTVCFNSFHFDITAFILPLACLVIWSFYFQNHYCFSEIATCILYNKLCQVNYSPKMHVHTLLLLTNVVLLAFRFLLRRLGMWSAPNSFFGFSRMYASCNRFRDYSYNGKYGTYIPFFSDIYSTWLCIHKLHF